jgi:hypothetical protein
MANLRILINILNSNQRYESKARSMMGNANKKRRAINAYRKCQRVIVLFRLMPRINLKDKERTPVWNVTDELEQEETMSVMEQNGVAEK